MSKSCLDCFHYNVCIYIQDGNDEYNEAESCEEFVPEEKIMLMEE